MIIDSVKVINGNEEAWECKINGREYIYTTQDDYFQSDSRGTYWRDAWTTLYPSDLNDFGQTIHNKYLPLDVNDPIKGIKKFLQLVMLK